MVFRHSDTFNYHIDTRPAFPLPLTGPKFIQRTNASKTAEGGFCGRCNFGRPIFTNAELDYDYHAIDIRIEYWRQ